MIQTVNYLILILITNKSLKAFYSYNSKSIVIDKCLILITFKENNFQSFDLLSE